MAKIDRLDPSRPIASLLEVTGLTQVELARRMKVAQPSVAAAIRRGERIGFDWLLRAIQVTDQRIDIRLLKDGA